MTYEDRKGGTRLDCYADTIVYNPARGKGPQPAAIRFGGEPEFISRTKRSNPWRLTCTKDDKNIIQAIEDGLKKGRISIPGSTYGAFAAPGQVRSRPVISLFPIILFPGSIDGAAESNPH